MEASVLFSEVVSKKSNIVAVPLVETQQSSGGTRLVECTDFSRSTQLDLVDLAQQIQNADNFTKANTCNKLMVISEQMCFLVEQARKVLVEANFNAQLHKTACNFRKIPGNVYYVYQRPSGQTYFSMISPEEWGTSCPHLFEGAYRLEQDLSWTPWNCIPQRSRDLQAMEGIVKLAISQGPLANDHVFNMMKLEQKGAEFPLSHENAMES